VKEIMTAIGLFACHDVTRIFHLQNSQISALNSVNVVICGGHPSVLKDPPFTEEYVIARRRSTHPVGSVLKLRPWNCQSLNYAWAYGDPSSESRSFASDFAHQHYYDR
jgi:hypothetical protein